MAFSEQDVVQHSWLIPPFAGVPSGRFVIHSQPDQAERTLDPLETTVPVNAGEISIVLTWKLTLPGKARTLNRASDSGNSNPTHTCTQINFDMPIIPLSRTESRCVVDFFC